MYVKSILKYCDVIGSPIKDWAVGSKLKSRSCRRKTYVVQMFRSQYCITSWSMIGFYTLLYVTLQRTRISYNESNEPNYLLNWYNAYWKFHKLIADYAKPAWVVTVEKEKAVRSWSGLKNMDIKTNYKHRGLKTS